MERLTINRNGRFRRVFWLPSWAAVPLVIAVFAGVFFLTRYWLRFYAVNQVLLQMDNWNEDGVLMQGTRFTCVPASLVMLLRDHGIMTDTLEITELCGTNTEGTDPDDIFRVGERFGFRVTKQTMGFEGLMARNLPAIVTFTWEGQFHAVYARPDRRKGWLEVKDPSVGLSTIDASLMTEYFGADEVECYLFEKAE